MQVTITGFTETSGIANIKALRALMGCDLRLAKMTYDVISGGFPQTVETVGSDNWAENFMSDHGIQFTRTRITAPRAHLTVLNALEQMPRNLNVSDIIAVLRAVRD